MVDSTDNFVARCTYVIRLRPVLFVSFFLVAGNVFLFTRMNAFGNLLFEFIQVHSDFSKKEVK